jgi:hypothetical protein
MRFLRWIVNWLRKSFRSTAGIYGDVADTVDREQVQKPEPKPPDKQPPKSA